MGNPISCCINRDRRGSRDDDMNTMIGERRNKKEYKRKMKDRKKELGLSQDSDLESEKS